MSSVNLVSHRGERAKFGVQIIKQKRVNFWRPQLINNHYGGTRKSNWEISGTHVSDLNEVQYELGLDSKKNLLSDISGSHERFSHQFYDFQRSSTPHK